MAVVASCRSCARSSCCTHAQTATHAAFVSASKASSSPSVAINADDRVVLRHDAVADVLRAEARQDGHELVELREHADGRVATCVMCVRSRRWRGPRGRLKFDFRARVATVATTFVACAFTASCSKSASLTSAPSTRPKLKSGSACGAMRKMCLNRMTPASAPLDLREGAVLASVVVGGVDLARAAACAGCRILD